MAEVPRKSSDATCYSPFSSHKPSLFSPELTHSKQSRPSHYSNHSRLTQSQLFDTLSRGTRQKEQQRLKEREAEI